MSGSRGARLRLLSASALALPAAIALLGCGGSSNPSSPSSARSSAPAGHAANGGAAAGASSFTALRECLKKQGVTLPQRVPGKPGQGAPPAGGAVPLAGGLQGLRKPPGTSRAKFDAALIKCGGGGRSGGPGAGSAARLRSPAFTKALAKFAACLRRSGVDVPKPDTGSAKYRAASQKCARLLNVARPGGQAAPPGAPTGAGAPGAG
jgi:hypothetical protein